MSTKIFDGYRIRETSFVKVNAVVSEFRARALAVLQTRYVARVAHEVARGLDALALGVGVICTDEQKRAPWDIPLLAGIHVVDDAMREIRKSGYRDPENDFSCSLSLFPQSRQTLVILYCEGANQGVAEALTAGGRVEPYGYWNNTDPPDDVSAKDWRLRGKHWKKALPGMGIPALCGYSISIVDDRGMGLEFPMAEKVAPIIPPRASRAKAWALDLLVAEQLKNVPKDDEYTWTTVLDVVRSVEEQPEKLEAKTNEVVERLPEITENMLMGAKEKDSGTGEGV